VHLRPGGASAGGELGRVESGGLAWAAWCAGASGAESMVARGVDLRQGQL
jgi:hypothetical protein